jgi:hypothetical protein
VFQKRYTFCLQFLHGTSLLHKFIWQVWLHYNETSSRAGIPFHFLLRDIGQFDNNLDDAFNRINNA